jgi:hypothetical protein
MQDHPISGVPRCAPSPGSVEFEVERWVLLELVTSPPPRGDDVPQLAAALRECERHVEAAVDALVDVGLATRNGPAIHATPAAMRFDALWPARM